MVPARGAAVKGVLFLMKNVSALGWILAIALGCSARAGVGGGGGGGDTDGGTSGVDVVRAGTADCASLCNRLQGAAGCAPTAVSTCMASCQSQLSVAGCEAAASALLTCASTATPSCAVGAFPFVGCTAQQNAYATCVVSLGRTDAGSTVGSDVVTVRDSGGVDMCASMTDCASCTRASSCGWCAGRCWSGTSSGPSAGSCGGDRWAWTSNQCSAPTVDAGITNPRITPQCQSCATTACTPVLTSCLGDSMCLSCLMSSGLTPACRANTNVAAVIECACGGCAEACSEACTGL